MRLPRVQLFEFNDAPWMPRRLKSHIIETLSLTMAWGRTLKGLVPAFEDFTRATGSSAVIDLCAGAGGPAAILAGELKRQGKVPPKFLLTDLLPQPETWEALRRLHPAAIDFDPNVVDATSLPARLRDDRPRMIVNALHHFPPPLARAVLEGAAKGSRGLFVAEGLVRNPARASAMLFTGIPALYLNPLLAQRSRLSKALWTWPLPLALGAAVWDGAVSSLRMYSREELQAMVEPWGHDWEWKWGTFAYPPWGRGSFFWGVPSH